MLRSYISQNKHGAPKVCRASVTNIPRLTFYHKLYLRTSHAAEFYKHKLKST